MSVTSLWTQYRDELANDPLLVLALSSALIALATTPMAFAVLGRLAWFKARRGRVLQRPEFSSIVVGMLLVMAIPAIFAALVLKSRSFDKDRYEFDPNRTWSVLEQGRGFQSLKEADAAVKQEMERLALERKNLVDNVKKLDEAMLALRSVAGTSPLVAQRFPSVLQSLAGVRKSVGLDGPQQLLDSTAPPVDLRAELVYEQSDGRAESLLGDVVKGMASACCLPAGERSNEIQLYLFEMPDSLRALGKYGSEKPDEAQSVAIGDQGYTTAGSTLF